LYLRRLQLKNFRNYTQLDLTFPRGNLLVLGDNAQGKSNLLEAIYLLASGRAVRTSTDAELIAWDAEPEPRPVARVTGSAELRDGSLQLEAIIAGGSSSPLEASRAGKRLRVNGIARRAADFVGLLRAVLFTAEDMAIVLGPPSERRRFLDAMLSQLDRRYYAAGQRYARILQQRNAALKRIKDGLGGPEELGFWDESLLNEGAVMVEARLRACNALAPMAAEFHSDLSGPAGERLEVAYCPRIGEGEADVASYESQADVREAMRAGIERLRRREMAAGMTLVGPHRDDLAITINGAAASSFGSRAQVRTATLSLRLAQARLFQQQGADSPLLLLDDIVSELDARRRRSVLASIADFDQVWFTSTDTHGFDEAFVGSASIYEVSGGRMTPRGD
jgi:DNA replication and repair protein RecF